MRLVNSYTISKTIAWVGVGWGWFVLVLGGGTVVLSTDSARFGLGLVWPGAGLVSGTVVLSHDSAWFGHGFAWFGSVQVLWNCCVFPCFCLVWAWFGSVRLGLCLVMCFSMMLFFRDGRLPIGEIPGSP